MAPDRVLALHYARELYGRRQESVRLWVVRRDDIAELDDPDLLQPPLDRSFKKPGGYVMRDKLARPRELAGQAKPQRDEAEKARDRRGGRGMTAATDLVPATRDALAVLLLAMADDEFVLGFSDSEWTGIAPILEEDVAMSSLAQDELGHAQALYRLLADLVDDGRDADAHRLRPTGRGLLPRPAARSPARRLGDDDRPALPVRHGRRGPARGARRVASYAPLARPRRQDPPRGALPRAPRRRPGSSGWPTGDGEARERLLGGDGAARPRRRDRADAAAERARAADGRRRWTPRSASSTRAGGRRSRRRSTGSACRRRPPAGDPGTRPDGPLRRVPLAPRRVRRVRRLDPEATW